MKHIGVVVLMITLAGIGCVSLTKDQERPTQVRLKVNAPPSVMADEINDRNAWEKLRAANEELEYELKGRGTGDAE